MARPLKAAQRKDARADLVAHAKHMVLTEGYATTSIDAINARAGLSKGTFYHYFKSKSELLDAVVEEITREGAANTRRAIEETEGGALERFKRFLDAARRWRLVALPETAEILRAVFRPENSLLRERMRDQSIRLAAPALSQLLEDGNAEGVFHVDDPQAAARVFLILAYGVSDDMVREVIASYPSPDASSIPPDASSVSHDALVAVLVPRGRAFLRAIEALLGVEPESLGEPDVALISGMVQTFWSGRAEQTGG